MEKKEQTITNFNNIMAKLKGIGLAIIFIGLATSLGMHGAAYGPGGGGRAPEKPQSPHANQYDVLNQFKALQIRPDLAERLLPQEIEKKSEIAMTVTPSGIRIPKEVHSSTFHYGYQGNRDNMQDDHSEAMSQRFDFFTVCDGHGLEGLFAAQTCAGYLYSKVYRLIAEACQQAAKSSRGKASRSVALREAFKSMDEKFLQLPQSNFGGTTVAIALVDKLTQEVYFAHVGDTRALLCSIDDGVLFATLDHSFTDPQDWDRIAHKGGVITSRAIGQRPRIMNSIDDASLMPSKTLYVSPKNDSEAYLNMPRSMEGALFKNIGVSAEPTISGPMPLPANGFLIIACDGVWDTLNNETAYATVKRAFQAGKDERQAARELASLAFAMGSTDNISVTVVYLNKYLTPIQAP